MTKERKFSLRLALFTIFSGLTLVSTVTGSLAWYAYSRSVTFSFVGTSVAKSALLSVGLVDDHNYLSDSDLEQYNLVRESHDSKSIVFTQSKDGFSVQAIRKYLFNSPNAVDKLFPLTTKARSISEEGDLNLYENPEYGETQTTVAAKPNEYVVLPFAFKIINEDAQYVPNKHVWLTEAVCRADQNIEQAIRVYIQGTERDFLMRPADASTTTGSTKVGGALDLDGDGTYDYNKGTDYEYAYGEFNNSMTYSATPYDTDPAPLDNVNGVSDTSEASTFLAKHHLDVYTANISAAQPKVAEFETFGTVKPTADDTGRYDPAVSGIPLASTNSGSKIGYATMTIFIEGWDHSVIDKAAGYSFNLGLRFEIDRI